MDRPKLYYMNNNIFDQEIHNKILVAISGGQDSLYLIKFIQDYKNDYQIIKRKTIYISYIYIDHQWRRDSYKHIKHIANYIKSFNENFYIYQLNENIISESISRIYRYNIILKHAIRNGYQHIITGHNKTDKIETFLHNFIRGNGIEGLTTLVSQIKVNNNIQLLRPLLNINRENIYWICKKFYLPIWSDTTNYIYSLSRNRIRNELIPYLKKYFHQNIENNINYLLNNYYNHHEYIKQSTMKLYLNSIHKNHMALNHVQLTKQHFILQFKTIQLFCIHNININIKHKIITKLIIHMNQKASKVYLRINLKYITLHVNNKWIYMTL
uniref:tRNA(Ile)-lysidine synthase, chloroplastic n=1 Tax=Chondria sp. (in: red algae) TaxID=1982705 RepID=A0A1Z1MQ83_9FLOR|nr:tRNA Ile-lysidine synthetase [Chondria sp. (in: red algae)]